MADFSFGHSQFVHFYYRSVQKLQKEVDRLEDELMSAKERNKKMEDDMEATFHDIQNM